MADRGFGDHKLYRVVTDELTFDYVLRFRDHITVTAATGEVRSAAAWVGPGGRARILRGASVTAERYPVGTVICVQDDAMKRGLDRLAVQHASTRAGLAPGLLAIEHQRYVMHCLEQHKAPQPPVNRLPRPEMNRQHAPPAARTHQIADRVQHLAQIRAGRPRLARAGRNNSTRSHSSFVRSVG